MCCLDKELAVSGKAKKLPCMHKIDISDPLACDSCIMHSVRLGSYSFVSTTNVSR